MTERTAIESVEELAAAILNAGHPSMWRLRLTIEADRKAVALAVLDELEAQRRVQRSEEHHAPGHALKELRRRIESGYWP